LYFPTYPRGVARAPRRTRAAAPGLAELRRSGATTELLFLYECTTREIPQLRVLADRLGLTVQATSHIFRQLARRGLAELREGRYRPTVAGVAWLHDSFARLREDIESRLGRLRIVRSSRAVAATDIDAGSRVSLRVRAGRLVASPGGAAGSRGVAAGSARRGDLVLVENLEGIVPLGRGRMEALTFPVSAIGDPALAARLRAEVRERPDSLLAASGLEASYLLERATDRPVLRFGVAAAVQEASSLGVDSLVVVLAEDLPRLLDGFVGPAPPPYTVTHLGPPLGPRAHRSARRTV
jgi:predicted transcriptional regulator